MKKNIFAIAIALSTLSISEINAQNQVYNYYDDEDGTPMYGVLRRVSPDGTWAVGGDEGDETGSIIVKVSEPEAPKIVVDGYLLDVDNNGLCVGAYYKNINGAKYKKAAIYVNDAWQLLPLPEEILGQSYAVAISADSKIIAGHGMCANEAPDEPGRYFPIIWELDESTGQYTLKRLYNNLYLPGTSGFFIQDMTPDAKYVCGYQCLDFGDIIAGLLNLETGEYTIWHEIKYEEFSFESFDQTWYSDGMFVDGILDGFDDNAQFGGMLCYATDKYIFGRRAIVYDVNGDGSGKINNVATIYDLENKTFTDGQSEYGYTCGISDRQAFTTNGKIFNDGITESLPAFVDTDEKIDIIYGIDNEGKTLAGARIAYSPWGEPYESPVLVVLKQPAFDGIEDITVGTNKAVISISGNKVSVAGADDVKIYDVKGSLVSAEAEATLNAGIYLIVADGFAHKAIVK